MTADPRRAPTRRPPSLRVAAAIAAAAACLLAPAPGPADAEGPAIELRGRVTQPDGAPIPGARMTIRLKRATSVACDDSGRFRATLRLPTVAMLERGPWIAQLDGAARGWRLMHAGGEPSLGIELTLDRGASGFRVVARSNDERFAALAAAAVARGEAHTLDGVRFLGTGGERSNDPPAPIMSFVAGVTLEARPEPAAKPEPAPEPVVARPQPPDTGAVRPPAPDTSRVAERQPDRVPEAPAARVEPDTRASRKLAAQRADSVRRENARRAGNDRRGTGGWVRVDRREKSARADSVRRENAARAEAARRATAARADSVRRANAARAESVRRADAARTDSVRRANVARAESVRVAARTPRSNEPRAANPIAATPDSRAAGEARVRAVDPQPAMGPATPPVVPRVNATPPEPPGPLVNPRRPDELPDPKGCSCRIHGTVELVPSSILERAETVVIRLEEWPAVADTVELYMGAPRSFRLAPVPCGSRRISVERVAPGLPPARIVTGQTMRGFGCASGELVQPRLVIALDRVRRRR